MVPLILGNLHIVWRWVLFFMRSLRPRELCWSAGTALGGSESSSPGPLPVHYLRDYNRVYVLGFI